MARTVGARLKQAGKIFYFDAGEHELETGEFIVVETSHGLAVGRVVVAPDQVIANESTSVEELKPIVRKATPEDIEKAEELKDRASAAVLTAKRKASEMRLNMSVSSGEFDLDGGQFTAYFTANDRVDFRNLVRDLSQELGARVQLLQVGDRDRAKLTDGFDICGERLCCSSWMTNFPTVSIRMAKEQDLPLNPQKISGVCGRLYCCLTFEYEDYKALRGTLPKQGSLLSTPAGEARVLSIDFNREVVRLVLTASGEQIEIDAIDFKLQNGLTIRPMELVRKIEGPHRVIGEDSARRQPAGASQRPSRGRGGPRPEAGPPSPGQSLPGVTRPQMQGLAPSPSLQPAQPQPGETAAGDDAARKRRRRRRRGGRGGGQGGGEAPAAPGGA